MIKTRDQVHRPAILIGIFSILILIYFILESQNDPNETQPIQSEPSYSLKKLLTSAEESYQSYIKKRDLIIKKDPTGINPWPNDYYYPSFWDYFLPLFNCPYSIRRLGDLGDGGKYICGLEVLSALEDRPCIVYSFGVSTESSFEAEILATSPCKIFAYDASVDGMGPEIAVGEPRVSFEKMYIGASDTKDTLTLGSMMGKNGHDWIDILKMDIESKEFEVLYQIMEEFEILPFGQLQLEIHGDQEGKTFPDVYKLWTKLEAKGMRPFKNEINPWRSILFNWKPLLMEYAFLNTKGHYSIVGL